ncbi:mechanosensitive ion channel domain-containing protein [Roseibium aestuarii]|uniref:Mechanosensitive ion channel domain-containing protein n=1 Tax=Roseibium aestuarii TaxID=2600299 RepID=A0ABW4JZT5_9HYPH|nr:mechanosensitive ion channel domain-containing protein [Roseibium aestuarii]
MLRKRLLPALATLLLTLLIVAPQALHAQGIPLNALMSSASSKASQDKVEATSSSAASGEATDAASSADAADALIRLLEDPAGRAALIETLKARETGAPASAETAAPANTDPSAPASGDTAGEAADTPAEETAASVPLAVQLGKYTGILVDETMVVVERVRHFLRGFEVIANGDVSLRWSRLTESLWQVVEIIATATVVFWLLQRLVGLLYRRLAPASSRGHFLWRLKYVVPFLLLDGLTLVLGALAAGAVALYEGLGFSEHLTQFQTFALNAFFLTHLFAIGLRMIFAPVRGALRLLPVSDETAKYWCRRLIGVTLWLGYGVMLAVPIANVSISFAVGNTVKFLIVFAVFIYLLLLIRANRAPVRRGIRAYAETLSGELSSRAMLFVSRIWDLLASVYVLVVFFIWLSRPLDAFTITMRSTLLSVLIVGAGFLFSAIVTRAITGGIRLPEEVRTKLPALQGRVNAFVPRILKIFRFLVFVTAVLLLLDVWGAVPFVSWVSSDAGQLFIGRYFSAFLVVVVSFCIWLAVMAWIDLRLREHAGYVVTARVRTLFQLFRNAFTVVILVMASLLALAEIGVDIGPLIAGAGVVGLAISFGAQTLVKDIITGAFIQIENAINEGDVVTVGGTTGVVERLTVRSVRLRDIDGTTHIVPFSSVDTVSNFMRDFAYHVAVIGVSYDTDIKKAKAALQEAFDRLRAEADFAPKILDDLEMHGVTAFADSSVNLRVRIKTLPGDQWSTGRAYNEFVKEVFDERGIEIPFPQVMYHSAPSTVVDQSGSRMASTPDDDDGAEGPTGAQDKPDIDIPDQDED